MVFGVVVYFHVYHFPLTCRVARQPRQSPPSVATFGTTHGNRDMVEWLMLESLLDTPETSCGVPATSCPTHLTCLVRRRTWLDVTSLPGTPQTSYQAHLKHLARRTWNIFPGTPETSWPAHLKHLARHTWNILPDTPETSCRAHLKHFARHTWNILPRAPQWNILPGAPETLFLPGAPETSHQKNIILARRTSKSCPPHRKHLATRRTWNILPGAKNDWVKRVKQKQEIAQLWRDDSLCDWDCCRHNKTK